MVWQYCADWWLIKYALGYINWVLVKSYISAILLTIKWDVSKYDYIDICNRSSKKMALYWGKAFFLLLAIGYTLIGCLLQTTQCLWVQIWINSMAVGVQLIVVNSGQSYQTHSKLFQTVNIGLPFSNSCLIYLI